MNRRYTDRHPDLRIDFEHAAEALLGVLDKLGRQTPPWDALGEPTLQCARDHARECLARLRAYEGHRNPALGTVSLADMVQSIVGLKPTSVTLTGPAFAAVCDRLAPHPLPASGAACDAEGQSFPPDRHEPSTPAGADAQRGAPVPEL